MAPRRRLAASWQLMQGGGLCRLKTGFRKWWFGLWSCLIMFDHVWSCLIMFDHVWSCLIMFDHVWSCLIMQSTFGVWRSCTCCSSDTILSEMVETDEHFQGSKASCFHCKTYCFFQNPFFTQNEIEAGECTIPWKRNIWTSKKELYKCM